MCLPWAAYYTKRLNVHMTSAMDFCIPHALHQPPSDLFGVVHKCRTGPHAAGCVVAVLVKAASTWPWLI
jgi:hypothetical protein